MFFYTIINLSSWLHLIYTIDTWKMLYIQVGIQDRHDIIIYRWIYL